MRVVVSPAPLPVVVAVLLQMVVVPLVRAMSSAMLTMPLMVVLPVVEIDRLVAVVEPLMVVVPLVRVMSLAVIEPVIVVVPLVKEISLAVILPSIVRVPLLVIAVELAEKQLVVMEKMPVVVMVLASMHPSTVRLE